MQEISIKIKNGLTERQKLILKGLIESYIEDGQAVSSERLRQTNPLSISSATIRIELANLKDQCLIYHLHTSSGCVPTDAGYRYFIDNIVDERELEPLEKEKLAEKLGYLTNEYNKLIKTTIKLLSDESANIVLGTLPNGEIYYSGIANLLRCLDSDFKESALDIIEAIDNFEQYRDLLPSELDGNKFYIGRENPIKEMDNYAMIISDYELPNWGRGMIYIIGPKRMPYQKVTSLLTYVSDFLSGKI